MAILPGSRIRKDGVFGTITDNPLTIGATTFNSADLNDLPVVSGNHAIVTLDPLRQFGDPEIILVTNHTAAATVATVQRGMFGTVARSRPQGTLWVHAARQDDYIQVLTSSTRPSDQYEGQLIYETDTDRYVGYDGSNWNTIAQMGAWTSYTPTLTQNNIAVAKTVNAARYQKIGRTVHFVAKLTLTANGTAGTPVRVGLPIAAFDTTDFYCGSGILFDASAAAVYRALLTKTGTNEVFLSPTNVTTADVLGVTAFSAALASGDVINITGTYEAVS